MLISKEERQYPFDGAKFDLNQEKDRRFLAWVFDQFLYGEVTGIQCGYWLYKAPHFNAATFLAKQAAEELSHVRRFLRIFSLIGEEPKKAHWAIRFLSTGMMGSSWGEHVALEMAIGEGLVLNIFYVLASTISDSEVSKILDSAVVEEERHVEFGERETLAWLKTYPGSKNLLLTLAFVQYSVMKRLKKRILKKISANFPESHPVLRHFEGFFQHTLNNFQTQMQRLGLVDAPLETFGILHKLKLLVFLPFEILRARLFFKTRLLTDSYLEDPTVLSEVKRFHPSSARPE